MDIRKISNYPFFAEIPGEGDDLDGGAGGAPPPPATGANEGEPGAGVGAKPDTTPPPPRTEEPPANQQETLDDADPPAELAEAQVQIQELKVELDSYKKAVKGLLDTNTQDLSAEDKDLLSTLAGKDPLKQLNALSTLKKAGKIGKVAKPITLKPDEGGRNAGGGAQHKEKPKTFADARKNLKADLVSAR